MISIQWCDSFSCTMKWIRHMYTHIPVLSDSLTNILPVLNRHRTLSWAAWTYTAGSHYLFYTWYCVYVNSNLPVHLSLPSPHCVHMSVLYLCLSTTALELSSSVPYVLSPLILLSNLWLLAAQDTCQMLLGYRISGSRLPRNVWENLFQCSPWNSWHLFWLDQFILWACLWTNHSDYEICHFDWITHASTP